jgi:hypothetical protein
MAIHLKHFSSQLIFFLCNIIASDLYITPSLPHRLTNHAIPESHPPSRHTTSAHASPRKRISIPLVVRSARKETTTGLLFVLATKQHVS